MKKFKFNLERLLRIREHEEQKWEIKLGKAVSECVRLENEITRRKAEISRMIKAGGRVQNREEVLLSMEMYKRRMTKEIKELGRKLEEAEKERDSVRETFLEVSKNRKVLTKLKEKREAEYYKEQKKLEFDEIDEINNGRVPGRALV